MRKNLKQLWQIAVQIGYQSIHCGPDASARGLSERVSYTPALSIDGEESHLIIIMLPFASPVFEII